MAIVAYGSWARDELTDRSDLDVIVTGDTAVNRDQYRRWDEAPLAWNGLNIEPHFIRFPEAGAPLSALWAEMAIEGVVLFEGSPIVSLHLAEVRRRLVTGEITRHSAHGQRYWIQGAAKKGG